MAPNLAWLFLDRIFRLHGLPDSIISDRGSIFISKFWSELTGSLLKIDTCTLTAYHPQTDSLMECTNQTLETYLYTYCSYQQDDWVDYLPLAKFAFNNLENSSHSMPITQHLNHRSPNTQPFPPLLTLLCDSMQFTLSFELSYNLLKTCRQSITTRRHYQHPSFNQASLSGSYIGTSKLHAHL